jgi:AcrR family transcriptional regulator
MGKKQELTKQKIIDTAIKLISFYGFNATTTALIAKESNLSEAIIFKYFGDKENLLQQIGNLAIEQIFDNISVIPMIENIETARSYPVKEFLKSIVMERFHFIEKNFELVKILIIEMQYNKELLSSAQKTIYPKVYQIVESVLQIIGMKMQVSRAQAQGIARIIFGTLISFVMQKCLFEVQFKPGEIEAEIDNILELIDFQ